MKCAYKMDISTEYYRMLVAGHRSNLSNRGRVGSIIHDFRPSPLIGPGGYPADQPPQGLSPAGLARLSSVVLASAPSVGVIVLMEEVPVRLATCFRVTSDDRRVVTAGHVARALMSEGASLECVLDPKPRSWPQKPAYRDLRVMFEAAPGHAPELLEIEAAEWAHDNWDLLLLRLKQASARPALAVAGPDAQLLPSGSEICIIGYPLVSPQGVPDEGLTAVFDGPLGGMRASPGLMRSRQPENAVGTYRHDASTLPGSSGSPLVDLLTGLVHGVHVWGGSGQTSPNSAVCLPDVLSEDALRARMQDGFNAAGAVPKVWLGSARPRELFGVSLAALHQSGAEFALVDAPPAQPLQDAVMPDRFDIRDQTYRPSLAQALGRVRPDRVTPEDIGLQTDPFSCTGFALAAAIELQLKGRRRPGGAKAPKISAAMLYGLATRFDEFIDDQPGGSSLRGAIKAFYNFGACAAEHAPYRGHDPGWHLTKDAAKDARFVTLGAYYRLQPVLADYQSAVQEARAIIVSAHLHTGWKRGARPLGRIPLRSGRQGAHAFVITGYDDRGFIIRNSWGPDWATWQGQPGHAHWSYADWAANVIDAWVLRLAPPAPMAFHLPPRLQQTDDKGPNPYARLRDLRQSSLIGHILHIERDGPRGDGRIGLGQTSIRETALYLATDSARKKYPALALIFHDPASAPDDLARLCGHMIGPLKANGIYPLHVLYGLDEFRSVILRLTEESRIAVERTKGSGERVSGFLDRRARAVVRPLWDIWQSGCQAAVQPGGGLWLGLAGIGLEACAPQHPPRDLHILSFGTGSVVAGSVVSAAAGLHLGPVSSLARVAPVSAVPGDLPSGTRLLDYGLAPELPKDAALPGADGDWSDLLSRLAGSATTPRAPRGTGKCLAEAATSAKTLNSVLRHMLKRSPALSRRFD